MRLRDTLTALPAIFLLSMAGCAGYLSQQEDSPVTTHTAPTIPEPRQSSPEPEPTPSATPKPAKTGLPKPGKNEVRICTEIFDKTPVTVAMSEEIERIRKDYAYICDIDWDLFESTDTWGEAWTPGATININEDFEMYRVYEDDPTEQLVFQVKETVRHEFGHQVIFQRYGMPGQDDELIQRFFGQTAEPDPINGEIPPNYNADEFAADILAATLNPDPNSPWRTRYDDTQIRRGTMTLELTQRIS